MSARHASLAVRTVTLASIPDDSRMPADMLVRTLPEEQALQYRDGDEYNVEVWPVSRAEQSMRERASGVAHPEEHQNRSGPESLITGRVREILHGPDRHAVLVVGGVELTPTELWALKDGLERGHRVEVKR